MKENDMLEHLFSTAAQLLGQREEALLERIAALEKRVDELEQKLREAAQAGVRVTADVAGIEEEIDGGNAGEEVLEIDGVEEVTDVEDIPEEEMLEIDGGEEVLEDDKISGEEDVFEDEDVSVEEDMMEMVEDVLETEEIEGEEIDDENDEDMDVEPEMEIELEFFDEEEEEREVEDVEIEDEQVLVVDKARPDWYDWEVDIPGGYIEDIWDGIGLNDRLLFLKELFRGDEIDFSETLDALNEMTTLVEVTEYIRGRYPFWDEESDEVYRFYMTVRRRFNKQRQEI